MGTAATAKFDVARFDTFPKVLRYNATHYSDDVAMREKDLGLWTEYTWSDYHNNVMRLALGLRELGLEPGDVVALIGDNRPQWVFSEIATHALQGVTIGLYRDVLDEELSYLLNYSGARFIVAEDEEQVDKLLGMEDRIPSVEKIIYWDVRGMRKYDDPRLMTMQEVEERGARCEAADPGIYDRLVDAGSGSDLAILCTTSGTTSHPKLAMLNSGKFLAHVAIYLAADPKDSSDEYVSVLPLSWIMEQVYVFGKSLVSRMKINFVESADTMMEDMREVGPTFLLLAPRVWETVAADVRSRIMDASPLKQKMFAFGLQRGLQALAEGRRSKFADVVLFRALRDRLGFSRLRSAATGGTALGPDTFKFFLAMGVPLRQLYGQTELMGAYTLHNPNDVDFDTVGVSFEGCEIRIDEPDEEGVGEIVTRHPNIFAGYYKNEEATKVELRDGWMYTGDAGYINKNQHLVVIDRVNDLSTTAAGIRFSPQYIENKLKFSPYVGEAVILGVGRDYLSTMICIRYSIVSKWAEKNRISFTTYTDLAARPEVYELIRTEVIGVNQSLPSAQRIQKFTLLYKELDADDGELTRTRKVRRGVVTERYGDIIDTLYSGRDVIDIDTTISLQDGTRQRIRTQLKVQSLESQSKWPAHDQVAAA